jgi:hypothetical protein
MAITINDYLKASQFVLSNILDETERIVLKNEKEITALNIAQIEDSKGSDGLELKNSNTQKFKGVYTLGTNLLNPSKKVGSKYNFLETGDFLGNFQVDILPSLTQIEIFSTGTGSGDKAEFFAGYKNIFGLNKSNQYKLNYEIILPQLMIFIKKYM